VLNSLLFYQKYDHAIYLSHIYIDFSKNYMFIPLHNVLGHFLYRMLLNILQGGWGAFFDNLREQSPYKPKEENKWKQE